LSKFVAALGTKDAQINNPATADDFFASLLAMSTVAIGMTKIGSGSGHPGAELFDSLKVWEAAAEWGVTKGESSRMLASVARSSDTLLKILEDKIQEWIDWRAAQPMDVVGDTDWASVKILEEGVVRVAKTCEKMEIICKNIKVESGRSLVNAAGKENATGARGAGKFTTLTAKIARFVNVGLSGICESYGMREVRVAGVNSSEGKYSLTEKKGKEKEKEKPVKKKKKRRVELLPVAPPVPKAAVESSDSDDDDEEMPAVNVLAVKRKRKAVVDSSSEEEEEKEEPAKDNWDQKVDDEDLQGASEDDGSSSDDSDAFGVVGEW